MRVHVIGGFLGAGKTTAIGALARYYAERGERVAIVTNDQGHALVDTAALVDVLDSKNGDSGVTEIGGGCFCCRYPELEDGLIAAAGQGATVALAEAVGSCTDLVATVLSPLADRQLQSMQLAPLAVLVDPFRVEEAERGDLPPDVAWLLAKQLEEADVIVTTHADESPPDVSAFLRAANPHAPIVALDATTGDGLGRWLTARPRQLAPVLDIDYDRYAAAEALLGWANARVVVSSAEPFSPADVFDRFFGAMSDEAVAHLKVRVVVESEHVEHVEHVEHAGHANLVRGGGAATFRLDDLPSQATQMSAIINARVATTPALLKEALELALQSAVGSADAVWSDFQAFEPGRPVPTHRYASRCGPDADGTCCAAFYQTPVVRYLLGDSFHPGGVRLTHQLAESLDLAEGASLLDVACGTGASLKAIGAKQSIGAFGIDLSPPEESSNIDFRAGDVHDIPFENNRFDALLCECALSTFGDQPLALSEMFRVLKPGGVVGISDVLRDGPLDENLSEWVHYGACLGHARTLDGYADLVRSAGFEVVDVVDCEWAAVDLLQTIKKRLVGAAMAEAAGQLPPGVTINVKAGRDAVVRAQQAVTDGRVGYGFLVARRPLAALESSCVASTLQ